MQCGSTNLIIITSHNIHQKRSPLCTVLVPAEGIRPEPAVGRPGLEAMPGRVLLVVAVVQVLVVATLSAAVASVDLPGRGNCRPGEPQPV